MTDPTDTTQTTGAAQAPSSYLTPEVLDELARLESAATEGPWRYDDKRFGEVGSLGDTLAENVARWPENMGFLTHLRNAAPALIAAARAWADLPKSAEEAFMMRTALTNRALVAEAERDAAVKRAEATEALRHSLRRKREALCQEMAEYEDPELKKACRAKVAGLSIAIRGLDEALSHPSREESPS